MGKEELDRTVSFDIATVKGFVESLKEVLYKTGQIMNEMALEVSEEMKEMPWQLHYMAESRQTVNDILQEICNSIDLNTINESL